MKNNISDENNTFDDYPMVMKKYLSIAYLGRGILFLGGCLATGIGIIGIFVPGLPTVVFFLIALYCFTRSSPRMEKWILTHPRIGPSVIAWQQHGVIEPKSKRLATMMIALSYGLMLYFAEPKLWLAILVAIILATVLIFIWTRPSKPRSLDSL